MTTFATVGPYDLNWETQQYKCWISQVITFTLLACLQAINLFWMFLILRIAVNIVFQSKVEDVRSDDEDTDMELEKKERVSQGETVAVEDKSSIAEEKIPAVEKLGNGKPLATAMNGNAVHSGNATKRKKSSVKQERR